VTGPDPSSLPVPSSVAEVITGEGGRVTFARFMEIALTHPTVGYYSRADRLLGYGGDFNTAPSTSPFFAKTLARLVTELVDAALAEGAATRETRGRKPVVVELGGGEGQLAEAMLRLWEGERPGFRSKIGYRVVEVGNGLRTRQAAAVRDMAAAGWDIGWGADLDEACAGVRPVAIVANEFLDTVSAHVVEVKDGTIGEVYVEAAGARLTQSWGALSMPAANEMELLFGTLDPERLQVFTADGILEVFPGLGDLTRQVAEVMPSGSLAIVDYGEWFEGAAGAGRGGSAVRHRRSVRGYFKHQLVADPLTRAGRQDLTADVDFAALDVHGRRGGFETVVFTTLATFLRGGGAEDELRTLRAATAEGGTDMLEADRQATVLENLLNDSDLGSAFKVMVLVKD
jgi:SAM-dependent MidA family methyltransferase